LNQQSRENNSRFLIPWWRSSGTGVRRGTEAKVVGVGSTNERACSCRPSWRASQYQQLQGGSVHNLENHLLSIREPESPISTSGQSCSGSCFLTHWQVRKRRDVCCMENRISTRMEQWRWRSSPCQLQF